MNLRIIDWIWHIRGSVALAPEQSSDDAFDRLAPLFRQTGTSHERTNDRLIFRKKDQADSKEGLCWCVHALARHHNGCWQHGGASYGTLLA